MAYRPFYCFVYISGLVKTDWLWHLFQSMHGMYFSYHMLLAQIDCKLLGLPEK